MTILDTLRTPDTWFYFVAFLSMAGLGGILGFLYGWTQGLARGRELQSMEPPPHGVMHHWKGNAIREIRAVSPDAAIDRLLRDAARKTSLVGPVSAPGTPWRRD